jgi:hypothetical protein
MRRMFVVRPMLSGYATILRIVVSLPYAAPLIDEVKYMSEQPPPPPSRDLRRLRQRGPTLKAMVKLAARCEDATELGERLLKRYQRKETHREAVELDARIDRLLASPD